jgi:hypothetical protein
MHANQHPLRFKAALAVVLACVLIFAAACGSSEEGEEEGDETPAAQSAVPESLDATESDAEDIVDLALANNRAELRQKAGELKTDAGEAADSLGEEDAPEDDLTQLRERASKVDELATGDAEPLQVALAANAVSALMPSLFGLFETDIPPDVLKLDYLDREAQLRSLAHENDKISAAVDELEQTWNGLRPQVVDAGGDDEAAKFAQHVAAMKKLAIAGNATALQREAVNGLELVDVLENVFA